MTRFEAVLAALAAAGENAYFTPVQVQKLFFLLDKEASHLINGPHFRFAPYDYGPFDREVYNTLDILAAQSSIQVGSNGRYRIYSLTQSGYQAGVSSLGRLPPLTRDYVVGIAQWVRQLSFEQLVSAIYNRYPEMKVNSVFQG